MTTAPFRQTKVGLKGIRLAFYYLYIAWLLGVGAVVFIPVGENGEPGNNFVFSLSWVAIHAISLFLILSFKGIVERGFLFCIGLSSFIVLSTVWSNAPFSTFVYGGMLVGNIVTAYMLSNDLPLDDIIRIVYRVIAFLIIAGLAAYFIGYEQVYHYDRHGRDNILSGVPLRGFFNHKVMASLFASIGVILILASATGLLRVLLVFLSVLFILLTGSATGLFLCVISIAMYFAVYASMRSGVRRANFLVGLVVGIGAFSALLYVAWFEVLDFLGRDGTLTGRTYLWELGLRVWTERPFFGWGFNGYFGSSESDAIRSYIGRYRNYDIPHFHQSYIQTAVDLGVIGLTLLVYVLFSSVYESYPRRNGFSLKTYSACFAVVCSMIIASFTMFLFFNYNHFANFFIFVAFFALNRAKWSGVS